MMSPDEMTPIEQLRCVVALFNNCGEDFAQRFSHRQLVTLWLAYRASGWDIAPDRWSVAQVREAMLGNAPNFDNETERPCRSVTTFKVYR